MIDIPKMQFEYVIIRVREKKRGFFEVLLTTELYIMIHEHRKFEIKLILKVLLRHDTFFMENLLLNGPFQFHDLFSFDHQWIPVLYTSSVYIKYIIFKFQCLK